MIAVLFLDGGPNRLLLIAVCQLGMTSCDRFCKAWAETAFEALHHEIRLDEIENGEFWLYLLSIAESSKR